MVLMLSGPAPASGRAISPRGQLVSVLLARWRRDYLAEGVFFRFQQTIG
jgi:hypothetical protein